MAKAEKTLVPVKEASRSGKPAVAKVKPLVPGTPKKSSEEAIAENVAALSQLVTSMAETLEMLVLKAESMAFHIIAAEEILAELVADNGLNLSRVNARIRLKTSSDPKNLTDPSKAIDIAAAIASPLPRR